jgi:hypothetical protein
VLITRREKLYQYNLWYLSFCIGDRIVCRSEVVLIQFVFPDDEHNVLETRSELKEIQSKELCVMLAIYQES